MKQIYPYPHYFVDCFMKNQSISVNILVKTLSWTWSVIGSHSANCIFLMRHNSHTMQFTLLKCTIQCVLVYSQSCTTSSLSNSRILHHSKRNPILISSHSPFLLTLSPLQPLGTTNLFSVSPEISYKRNHTISGICI